MIEYELFKISTSEDDDEDRERPLTEEEWKAMQAQFGDMTPEEMQAIREDMGHTQYPQIPYENIPEANRPDISAFEDAFNDDDPDLTKAISVFKRLLEKEHPFTEGMRRQEEEQETLHSGKGSWNAGIETGPVAERMSKPRQQRLNQRKDDPTYERRLRAMQAATKRIDESKLNKLYKAYALNKRINIKDQQRGAPGLGIHPQDIAARRADAKRLQQEKFRSNKDANIGMDMARDIQSGNFQSRDPKDTSKVIPQTTAFPRESYVPRAKKFGEQLIETENQMIRSNRDQGPDVPVGSNFKPKPTDTMTKPTLSSTKFRHRDMQNRPEDRGAWTRDTQNPTPMPGGRQMKWESTSDLVNTALGRPKGTPTVQQGKMNIAPTGYKPQTQTPLKGAQWKGANKKAAASTYTPGTNSASQLEI